MYKKLGVLLSASVLATAGLVPIISNGRNVQASTVDTVKDNSKLNYDDNEPIDSWMPDKYLQQYVLRNLQWDLPEGSTVKDITKKDMLKLDYLFINGSYNNPEERVPSDSDEHILDVKSFEGLQYAKNLTSFEYVIETGNSLGFDWSIVPDVSPLLQLDKLNSVSFYGVFPRNGDIGSIFQKFFDSTNVSSLAIGGEDYIVLDKKLEFNKDNYKHLSVPFSYFLNISPTDYNCRHFNGKTFQIKIGNRILKYTCSIDKNRMINFDLLTSNVSYNELAGKKVDTAGKTLASDSVDVNVAAVFVYSGKYQNRIDLGSTMISMFKEVVFAPENQNISDLTELYNKVKYSTSYSGDMFNSQPGNSMKYKDEFNDKTMFGAMDHAYNSKDYDGLVKLMHDSVKKTHESIGSLQVNEAKAKELGLNVDQLKSDLTKDSVPYDYSQDNDIDGINKQLDSFASVRAKYNKLVQQGVFDKSDYWTMNK